MTNIELVAVENLKSMATRNFIYESSYKIKNEDDTQIEEYILLQVRSIILGCEQTVAKINNWAIYNMPTFKMYVFHVMANNKERLFVASVFKNADVPNGKLAKK